jgi:hypothetical protein
MYAGLTVFVFIPMYNQAEKENSSRVSYALFGEKISTLKALFWPATFVSSYFSKTTKEPLMNESERVIFGSIISKAQTDLLDSSDITALNQMVSSYSKRTGKTYTKSEVEELRTHLHLAADYQDELIVSSLMSWDLRKRTTTRKFDELFEKMRGFGRTEEQLEADQLTLACAALNETVRTDRAGNKHAFGREIIRSKLGEGEVVRRNADVIARCLLGEAN